ATVCQFDVRNLYNQIQPNITRAGISGHGAFELPNGVQGWVEANYMQDTVSKPSTPPPLFWNAPAGIFHPFFTTQGNYRPGANPLGSLQLFLPVWVCPERTNCATSPDRKLNPNNPFAADGGATAHAAALIGRDMTRTTGAQTYNHTYRVAGGLS